jgi:hypothetical protein
VKNSTIFNELDSVKRKDFFDIRDKKFIHNIDSLYYVVKVKQEWNKDLGCRRLVNYLKSKKAEAVKQFDPITLFQNGNTNILGSSFTMNGIGSKPYQFDIEKKDKYMCFVIEHQLNENTPELWIQIRSQYLWLYGEHVAVRDSLQDIENILSVFNIDILEVKENRIDFAYHTNYIQDVLKHFEEKNLNRMQQSNFSRYSKEGKFVGEFEIENDYVTLGRKKSNNLFFRIYNKSKEVVEQGYKQFFLKIWYFEKLINYYDFYCYEKAFKQANYKYVDIARLEFYIENGLNQEYKGQALELINSQNRDYEKIKKLADILTPKVTLIVNVEIETKRKFYYSLDDNIDALLKVKSKDAKDYARSLYLKIDNKKVLHDYLTRNNTKNEGIIRFLDYKAKNKFGESWTKKAKFPTAVWWKKLQSCKVNWRFEEEQVDLVRQYQKSLDIEKMKKRAVNSISTYKVYLSHDDSVNTSFEDDILDFLSTLNESDIEKQLENKRKKFTQLSARLEGLEKTEAIRTFKLLDTETGELHD